MPSALMSGSGYSAPGRTATGHLGGAASSSSNAGKQQAQAVPMEVDDDFYQEGASLGALQDDYHGVDDDQVSPLQKEECLADELYGAWILRRFDDGMQFEGRVVGIDMTNLGTRLYLVQYMDGDCEHLDKIDVLKHQNHKKEIPEKTKRPAAKKASIADAGHAHKGKSSTAMKSASSMKSGAKQLVLPGENAGDESAEAQPNAPSMKKKEQEEIRAMKVGKGNSKKKKMKAVQPVQVAPKASPKGKAKVVEVAPVIIKAEAKQASKSSTSSGGSKGKGEGGGLQAKSKAAAKAKGKAKAKASPKAKPKAAPKPKVEKRAVAAPKRGAAVSMSMKAGASAKEVRKKLSMKKLQ